MALLLIGFFVAHPVITAPAINPAASAPTSDIPNLMPLLFITIACGAISGFHSLASGYSGAANLFSSYGIPPAVGKTIIAVFI
jgi:carbon starvation protein